MQKRIYRLADGRLATVEPTPNGIIVRTNSGEIVTVSTRSL